jgi:hypothetical protein
MLPGNVSLAKLIKDHGDRWVIEHTGASTAWVAVRRDDLSVIGARDIGGLRFHIERTDREDEALAATPEAEAMP